jgi:hypothetical protein
MFGEEFARKFTYNEMNYDMYEVVEETGKLLNINVVPPTKKDYYFGQLRRMAKAVGEMGKNSPSKFMKPFLEALNKG